MRQFFSFPVANATHCTRSELEPPLRAITREHPQVRSLGRGTHFAQLLFEPVQEGRSGRFRMLCLVSFVIPPDHRILDFGQTPLGWTIHGSLNGWHAEHGDYAGVLELLLEAGATAPPLTADVRASEAVLAVLRRRTRA